MQRSSASYGQMVPPIHSRKEAGMGWKEEGRRGRGGEGCRQEGVASHYKDAVAAHCQTRARARAQRAQKLEPFNEMLGVQCKHEVA